jgi:DNA-binding MarR family transcriptional regulator
MQAAGEVTRQPHPEDGRAVCLSLTAHGTKLAESVDASSALHFEALTERLGAELSDVVRALHALTRAMQTRKEQP